MSGSPSSFPDPEEARKLHQRLLNADDVLAQSDLATAFLEPLIFWLGEHNRRIDPELCAQAAGDALVSLIHNPASYRPNLQPLEAYLCMSAQGDLRNLLRKERKHHARRTPWMNVELSPDAGKYLGRDDDPSLPLQIAEQQQEMHAAIPPSVRSSLTEAEARVLDLMCRKVRTTAAYAEACGITHLPVEEQRREVKRVKDRLKNRLKRAETSQ